MYALHSTVQCILQTVLPGNELVGLQSCYLFVPVNKVYIVRKAALHGQGKGANHARPHAKGGIWSRAKSHL